MRASTDRLGADSASPLSSTGSDAPPLVTIAGPHGQRAASDPAGRAVDTGRFVILPMRDRHETLIGIKRPSGGRWDDHPRAGVAGDLRRRSRQRPPTGADRRHRTRPRARPGTALVVRPLAGQTVTFAERAGQVFHVLGDAHGTRGQLTFTPASGRAGRREIVALISLSGVQRLESVVGHYIAPGPARAAAPRWLRLAHRGPDVVARWGAGAGAQRYAATVSLSDGERLAFSRPPADRSITIRAGMGGLGATVTVMGIGPDGNAGAARSARLRPTTPARVHGITAARTRAGVLVRWRAVPGAARYLGVHHRRRSHGGSIR